MTAKAALAGRRLQAWLVSMLSIVADAYGAGEVLGAGAPFTFEGQTLSPAAALRDADGHLVLVADVLETRGDAAARRAAYAAAGVGECWQLSPDGARAELYQRSAAGGYDLIPPDSRGTHFSAVFEELVFPVTWFVERPRALDMMQAWGLIDLE